MATDHAVVLYEETDTSTEVVTVAGSLAGYSGRTREAYTLDLRQFLRRIDAHGLALFSVTRTHIEVYARQLEDEGKAPATMVVGCRRWPGSIGTRWRKPFDAGASQGRQDRDDPARTSDTWVDVEQIAAANAAPGSLDASRYDDWRLLRRIRAIWG